MSNIVRSRALSAKSKPPSRNHPNQSKPGFQIKWKDKTNGSKLYDAPPSSHNEQNSQMLTDSFYDDYAKKIIKHRKATSLYNKTNNSNNKTQTQLCYLNFKHHDPDLCVCQLCICGRHLCKLHVVGPNLSKTTVYQMSYPKKGMIPNKINISKEYPKCEGPHLDINSIQRKDYNGRQGDDIERPIPQDLLKAGGPCNKLTSYSSGFPGYKCDNQYIPPTDRHVRGPMRLNAKTTYGNFFRPGNGRKASLQKTNDSFRHGQPWYGSSHYSNQFKNPTVQDYPKHSKIIQKYEQNPNFKNQYETIYRNDFLNNGSKVCPSKLKLQTILRGRMTQTKAKFCQNTDFKALSPQFHALSLSKQTFV